MTQPAPDPSASTEPEVSSREQVDHPHLAPVANALYTLAEQPEPAPETAETDTTDEEQEPEQAGPDGWQDRAADVFEQARGFVSPPDVWNEDRPALVKMWRYANYSEQLPPTGVVRYLAIGYRALANVYDARDYTKSWIRERPSRAALFAVLLSLSAVFPPTRMLLTVLLTPAYFFIELITNY